MNEGTLQNVKRALLAMQRMSWEQGVTAQAFFEIGDNQMGVLLAREAVHRQASDGRLANMLFSFANVSFMDPSTDPGSNGEAVLKAYEITKDDSFKLAADRMRDWFLYKAPKSTDGTIYYTQQSPEIISDAVYMIAPFLAAVGCYDEAIVQIEGHKRYLYDPKKRLYHSKWNNGWRKMTAPQFWGGGNGWVAAGLARTYSWLPKNKHKEREFIKSHLKELVDGWLGYLPEEGIFHDNIDESSTFIETTSSLMLSYAIYKGIKAGSLDGQYLEPANRMREAAFGRIDEYGIVQGAAGAPDFQIPGTSAEAQAFAIMSEAAFRDLNA